MRKENEVEPNECAVMLLRLIESACDVCGLSLAVLDKEIAFIKEIDGEKHVIAMWNPQFNKGGENT